MLVNLEKLRLVISNVNSITNLTKLNDLILVGCNNISFINNLDRIDNIIINSCDYLMSMNKIVNSNE